MTAVDVLHAVKQAGGRLLPKGDKLIIEAPTPLPADVITLVCQHKSALLALLHQEPPALPSDRPGQLTLTSTPQPWERPGACYACGTTRRWRSVYGVVVCARCHPPADAALVTGWADQDMGKTIDTKEGDR
jgi:hypothetical protein